MSRILFQIAALENLFPDFKIEFNSPQLHFPPQKNRNMQMLLDSFKIKWDTSEKGGNWKKIKFH